MASTLLTEVGDMFDSHSTLAQVIENLQRRAWTGTLNSHFLRALIWRLFLGIIPSDLSMDFWVSHTAQLADKYDKLKDQEFPKVDRVAVDPLSALTESESESEEWKKYYKDVELCNFILVDLDRLYMNGIDDDYFQTKARRDMLVSILFLWAAKHPAISYRQGMHEIVGPILFCVESEFEIFSSCQCEIRDNFPFLGGCFDKKEWVEAHSYWIFERVMDELSILYDPNPPVASSSTQSDVALPTIVSFCAKVQEHFLRDLDPELCTHLEESFVQSQLYGMRWCRLLFGREISVTPSHGLKVWDYIFACCVVSTHNYYCYNNNVQFVYANTKAKEGQTPLFAKAELQNRMESGMLAMISSKSGYTPMIAAVADVMLAMLLKIREELVVGDSNTVMMLLMRYPEVQDVTMLLDYADMIRRGVLRTGAHTGTDLSPMGELEVQSAAGISRSAPQHAQKPPAWLNLNMNVRANLSENMSNFKQKVSNSFTFGRLSNGQKQPSQDPNPLSANTEPSDDPIAALFGPVGSLAADATSGIISMAFPYLGTEAANDNRPMDTQPNLIPSTESSQRIDEMQKIIVGVSARLKQVAISTAMDLRLRDNLLSLALILDGKSSVQHYDAQYFPVDNEHLAASPINCDNSAISASNQNAKHSQNVSIYRSEATPLIVEAANLQSEAPSIPTRALAEVAADKPSVSQPQLRSQDLLTDKSPAPNATLLNDLLGSSAAPSSKSSSQRDFTFSTFFEEKQRQKMSSEIDRIFF